MLCTGRLINTTQDWESGRLQLTFEINETTARSQVDAIAGCEKLRIEAVQFREKRSLDANRYCWKLCDKIAQRIRSTKEEVYRDAIRSVGVFSDVVVYADAVESLVNGWERNGTGWFAETVDNVAEMKTIRLYYGSSTYNTQQMARLIDEIINYCKDVGVEYLAPAELERMKAAWQSQ